MSYFFEIAKNGQYTCKFNDGIQSKYIYSKYNPSNIKYNWTLQPDAEGYILLGIGLGYEYLYLQTQTSKPIYVIEPNETFKSYIEMYTELEPKYINNLLTNYQLLVNEQLYPFEKDLYNSILKQLSITTGAKLIYMLAYNVIAKDCKEAFEELGYDVVWMTVGDFKNWVTNPEKIPDYFFSINYQPWLGELAEQLKRPYISWTVDTPSYSLFLKSNLQKSYSYMFHYDLTVAEKLRERGLQHVYYLPVAANPERLSKVIAQEGSMDVSFLGNSCGHNEFETYIKSFLTTAELKEIEELISKQMQTSEFIIEKSISNNLVQKIINTPGLMLPEGLVEVLSPREIVALLIGRQHSYFERTALVRRLEKTYDFKVYGDKYWETIQSASYAGHAEHYLEMPAIFKQSKINLNIIRSFVDSGLPMRVFDVLGSGSFLLTNAKQDIYKYFNDGEHLVVFNDFNDLVEKINYYLQHEKERKKIAQNGLDLVKKHHTFAIRLKQMVEILAQEGV